MLLPALWWVCLAFAPSSFLLSLAASTLSIGALFSLTQAGLPYDPANPMPISAYDCYTTAAVSADRWWASEPLMRAMCCVSPWPSLLLPLSVPQNCTGDAGYVAFKYQLGLINARSDLLPNTNLTLDAIEDQGSGGDSAPPAS